MAQFNRWVKIKCNFNVEIRRKKKASALSQECFVSMTGVILPLANAPAPWSLVHSFQIQQSPTQNPQTRPLQSPGFPLLPAFANLT